MGGSYQTLCETENYKFSIYENHSDEYMVYELRVERKT